VSLSSTKAVVEGRSTGRSTGADRSSAGVEGVIEGSVEMISVEMSSVGGVGMGAGESTIVDLIGPPGGVITGVVTEGGVITGRSIGVVGGYVAGVVTGVSLGVGATYGTYGGIVGGTYVEGVPVVLFGRGGALASSER